VLLLLCLVAFATSAVLFHTHEEPVDSEYILSFHSNVSSLVVESFTRKLSYEQGVEVIRSFSITKWRALHVKLTPEALAKRLSESEYFDFVEQNSVVRLDAVEQECALQNNVEWGLRRISYKDIPGPGDPYLYLGDGAGVTSYIIDTGISLIHEEFADGDRATFGFNAVTGERDDDCNGHGTHVAGTVGGRVYGVAKKVSLVAVKVLNCQGSGTFAGVIAGIDWVTADHEKKKGPSNANMSLGGGNSPAVVQAVTNSIAGGTGYSIAAGNSNANACNYSPANTPDGVCVGATTITGTGTTQTDVRSSFSNYGPCVHVFAPGQLVKSAWIPFVDSVNTISGTSMAAPHVCGRMSIIQGRYPEMTPAQIKAIISEEQATTGVLNLNCGTNAVCLESPDAFLRSDCN